MRNIIFKILGTFISHNGVFSNFDVEYVNLNETENSNETVNSNATDHGNKEFLSMIFGTLWVFLLNFRVLLTTCYQVN